MKWKLDIDIPNLVKPIDYQDKIYLTGSCFTEHISRFLGNAKFPTCENSHGILFNPLSVCKGLQDIASNKKYVETELFQLDEYWHSWFHHSDFSDLKKENTLTKINETIEMHHQFLKNASRVIITLGSAFAYFHLKDGFYVSNNHRAPSQWFRKDLLSIEAITHELKATQELLKNLNPKLQFIYTISPVRHARDGVIENNRSKARLLEAVHSLEDAYYFPAYELVIDILRDYRFYDVDMVHPNYQATSYVWEQFVEHCISTETLPLLKKLEQITKAKNHKPKSTESQAHKKFMQEHFELCTLLQSQNPILDLHEELQYFGTFVSS